MVLFFFASMRFVVDSEAEKSGKKEKNFFFLHERKPSIIENETPRRPFYLSLRSLSLSLCALSLSLRSLFLSISLTLSFLSLEIA